MHKAKVRRMFPGNNTSKGFFSYYQYIMPQPQANHIFCIKGGPGVGKSTFMKKVGQRMEDEGRDVVYLHCSSDPDSLDGVVIPDICVALVDGTAPHVVDPINPGAVDEIINLGECWDSAGMKKNKSQIMQTNTEVGRLFKRAYRYIAAAKNIYDDMAENYYQATNQAGAYFEAEMLIEKELTQMPVGCTLGNIKKQFASAITPNGIMHFLDTLVDETYRVYAFRGIPGIGVSHLLKRIFESTVTRGLDTEVYYCPMEPATKIEHIIIPKLKLAFITENGYHSLSHCKKTVIDMTQYINKDGIDKDALSFGKDNFQTLLNEGVATLSKAKKTHDDMEGYYVPNMDFDQVQKKLDNTMQRILDMK